ncbi:MAG: hypothetical protein ACFCVB_20790 [Nodosilinea sp.]
MVFFRRWRVGQQLRVGGAALGAGLVQYQISQAGQRLFAQQQVSRGSELMAIGLSLGVGLLAVTGYRRLNLGQSFCLRGFLTLFLLVNGLFFALFAAFFLGQSASELILIGPLLTFILVITSTGLIAEIVNRYMSRRLDLPSVALLFYGFNVLVWVVLIGLVAPLTALGLWVGWLAVGLAVLATGALPLVLGGAAIASLALVMGTALLTNRSLDATWATIVGRSLVTTLKMAGPVVGLTTILTLGINRQLWTHTHPLTQPLQSLAQAIQVWGSCDQ